MTEQPSKPTITKAPIPEVPTKEIHVIHKPNTGIGSYLGMFGRAVGKTIIFGTKCVVYTTLATAAVVTTGALVYATNKDRFDTAVINCSTNNPIKRTAIHAVRVADGDWVSLCSIAFDEKNRRW